jgi:hypothetical protein
VSLTPAGLSIVARGDRWTVCSLLVWVSEHNGILNSVVRSIDTHWMLPTDMDRGFNVVGG